VIGRRTENDDNRSEYGVSSGLASMPLISRLHLSFLIAGAAKWLQMKKSTLEVTNGLTTSFELAA
jgi:hypothetical protein